MSKTYMNIGARLAVCCTVMFSLILPASAQTWQQQGKTATIPVVVANTSCNSTADTVGITADRTSLLTCQSGLWTKTGGSNLFKIADAVNKTTFYGVGSGSTNGTGGTRAYSAWTTNAVRYRVVSSSSGVYQLEYDAWNLIPSMWSLKCTLDSAGTCDLGTGIVLSVTAAGVVTQDFNHNPGIYPWAW